jgi:anti-anti-sigma factor
MLDYITIDDSLICVFSGRLDTVDTGKIENELLDKIQHCGMKVIFDFSKLEYVASMFLRLSVKAARITGANKIKVIHASDDIKHIFTMTGFDKLMDIE